MNLTRLLADPPSTPFNLSGLTAPGVVAVNMVGGQIAGYWPEGAAPTQVDWQAIVSAHVPTPDPDPVADLLAALPAATLEEVNDLLAQVLATLGGQ